MPWLNWRDMSEEPHDYELLLYLSEDGEPWVGNHPEGHARGLWYKGSGGQSNSRPVTKWARIPLPVS